MYSLQTIQEYSAALPTKPTKIGARIDYRLIKELNEFETDAFTKELSEFCNSVGIELSGFGYKNYSGILMSGFSESNFRKKISRLKEWSILKNQQIKMLKIGRVQQVDDIFFE